jgi:hypothetical protein
MCSIKKRLKKVKEEYFYEYATNNATSTKNAKRYYE